jgi:hypothetical protein
MAVSVVRVVLLTAFLVLGMVMAGVFTQPRASIDVWNIKESDFPANGSAPDKLTFLLNYAILAPSSYNTQPWRFNLSGDEIRLYADRTRWLTVADADKRELNLSLGCALENLVLAGEYFGYSCNISYPQGDGSLAAVIKLTPGGEESKDAALFDAMLARCTNSDWYENRTISKSELQMLQNISLDDGIHLYMTSNEETRNKILNLVANADRAEYADSNYKSELGYWLGQGMMGPTGVEARAAQMVVLFLDTGSGQIDKDTRLVASAPTLFFICTDRNDGISQIKAGSAFERLRLAACAMGICSSPMNQVLEQPQTKEEISRLLPSGAGYPQQAFLAGYAAQPDEHLPRIPVREQMVRKDRPSL